MTTEREWPWSGWLAFLERDGHDLAAVERHAGQGEAAAVDCVRRIEVLRGAAVAAVQRCAARAAQLGADGLRERVELPLEAAREVAEYTRSRILLGSAAGGVAVDWAAWPAGLSPARRWHTGVAAFVTAGLLVRRTGWRPYLACDATADCYRETAARYSASAVETLAALEYRDDEAREYDARRADEAWETSARYDRLEAGCRGLADLVHWTEQALELVVNNAQALYDRCVCEGARAAGDRWAAQYRSDAEGVVADFERDAEAIQRGISPDALPVRPQLPLAEKQ